MERKTVEISRLMSIANYAKLIGKSTRRGYQLAKEKKEEIITIEGHLFVYIKKDHE